MPTVASLFAGVGGFDLAFTRAGYAITSAVEIDPAARGVLAERFPETILHNDVTEVTGDQLRADGFVPDGGVLVGGFPCQDLSVAGRRAGLAGSRSGLFWHIDRLLAELRPEWVVLENVPGLLSSNGGRDMGAVLGSLAQRGYGYAFRVLDARHFGVPQRRRRVFIVGHLGDHRGPVEVLLKPESSGRDSAPSDEAGQDIAGTLGGGSGSRGWAPDTDRMTFVPVHALVTVGGDVTHTLRAEGHDASEDGTGRGTPIVAYPFVKARRAGEDDPSPESWKRSETHPTLASHSTDTTSAVVTASHLTQDPISDAVSPALTIGNSEGCSTIGVGLGSAESAYAVRRLTPTECERLQGFPDSWTAVSAGRNQADSARYKQMGNAVAVPVVEWIARRIAAYSNREG